MSNPFNVFRRNQKSLLAVFGILIMFVFTVGGVLTQMQGGGQTGDGEVIATWDGGEITEGDYYRRKGLHDRVISLLRKLIQEAEGRGGDPRMPGITREQGFVVDPGIPAADSEVAMIMQTLKAQKAEEIGVIVTDDAVLDFFDQITDLKVARDEIGPIREQMFGNSLPEASLFSYLRTALAAQSVDQLFSAPPPTSGEYFDYFRKLNLSVKAEGVKIDALAYTGDVAQPKEEELKEFFEEHKVYTADDFRNQPGFLIPQKRKFGYFNAALDDFIELAKKEVTEAEIAETYARRVEQEDSSVIEILPIEPEEPSTEEPSTEEPSTEEPSTEEPGAETPGNEEPGNETPGSEEPGTEEPGTPEEPASPMEPSTEPEDPQPSVDPPADPPMEPAPAEPEPMDPADPVPPADESIPEPPAPADSAPADSAPEPPAEDGVSAPSEGSFVFLQDEPNGDDPAPSAPENGNENGNGSAADPGTDIDFPNLDDLNAPGDVDLTLDAEPSLVEEGISFDEGSLLPVQSLAELIPPPKPTTRKRIRPLDEVRDDIRASLAALGHQDDDGNWIRKPARETYNAAVEALRKELRAYSRAYSDYEMALKRKESATKPAKLDYEALGKKYNVKFVRTELASQAELSLGPELFELNKQRQELETQMNDLPEGNESTAKKEELQKQIDAINEKMEELRGQFGAAQRIDFRMQRAIPLLEEAFGYNYPLFQTREFEVLDFTGLSSFRPSRTFLYWMEEKTESRVPEYSEVKEDVLKWYRRSKAIDEAKAAAEKLAAQAEKDGNLKSVAKSKNARVVDFGEFTWMTNSGMQESIPQLTQVPGTFGAGETFMEAVFSTPVGKVAVAPNEIGTEVYLVKILQKSPNSEELQRRFLNEGISRSLERMADINAYRYAVEWQKALQDEYNLVMP